MSKHEKQIKWTAAQNLAIETVGRTVLVAASAGTGKTAALSGRAVARIADPHAPTEADSLLVLTFTDAAAEEMRSRIADTLYKESRKSHNGQLARQLLLLDRANISTIHAFCKRMLTQFFYLAGLDPAFGMLDADEQRLLKSEVLDDTLEAAWADAEFAPRLTGLLNGRRVQPGTNSFIDLVIPLAEFLDSVAARERFYDSAAAINDLADRAYGELKQSQKKGMLDKLAQCLARLDRAMMLDRQYCNGQYATDYITNCVLPVVDQTRVLLEQNRLDLCRQNLAQLTFEKMPAFKKNQWPEEYKDLIKEPIEHVREKLKQLSDFALLSEGYEDRIGAPAAAQTKTLLELLARFDRAYAEAKRRRNVLDFADLEHRMLALLSSRPEVAADLRRRFEYIFVDEYQDINAVQQSILEHLRRDDNLFVVGDVKQSIYGFRQSKPEIFLRQLGAAKEAGDRSTMPCRIDLRENFRCRGEIIDFVNALFARTMTAGAADMDYDARAALVCGFQYPPFEADSGPDEPVELVLLDEDAPDDEEETGQDDGKEPSAAPGISSVQRQAAWIAQRIRRLVGADTGRPEIHIYDKKTESTRPVEYRDVVILMRSLSHKARQYVEILRLAGVPVNSQSACGYFEAAEISDCLCLLKVLDNPDRDIELAGLLRSPVFDFSDTELAHIRLCGPKKASFYEALRSHAVSGSDPGLRQKAEQTLAQIRDWRSQARSGSLADLLDRVLHERNLLSFYAALPNGSQRRANLLKLHDHAIQFEHFRTTEPGAALGRFVEFMEKMAEEEQDWAPAEPDSSGENAVRIMSIHKSKGLEFAVVFVAELNTQFNMKDAAGECLISEQTIGLQIPDRRAGCRYPSMAHQVIAEGKRRLTIAEEMRILYVALTRAREKLILTCSRREKACIAPLRQCAALHQAPADWMLSEARCLGDWILMGLGNCEMLHRAYQTGVTQNLVQGPRFFVQRIDRGQLEETTVRILQERRRLQSITTPKTKSDAHAAFENIRHNLQWRYPCESAVMTSAKCSVSDLIYRQGASDAAFRLKPAAVLTPSKGPGTDALAVGSAFHALLEALPLDKTIDTNIIQKTLRQLIHTGQITDASANQVDPTAVLCFFESPLGRLLLAHADNALREWPFTYALDSRLAQADAGETVVLQGIVDLIIPTEKGLVIVDFKTDHIAAAQVDERSQQYSGQLRYYAMAAAAILGQPLSGAWIYYVVPRKAVEILL